jgi:hypothetical protein
MSYTWNELLPNSSSCLGPYYLPIPPREWYRVQNECSLNTADPPTTVNVPLIGITVPYQLGFYYTSQINKGNILQYKKNSSNLTKQQRYSQIAKGMWTNRNTTWATQSDRYTNPNTQSLKRVNAINITLNETETLAPITCPKIETPVYNSLPVTPALPSNMNPVIPPPPPTPGEPTNFIPVVPNPTPVPPVVIPDLGNLLCNTMENLCTGETFTQPANQNYHPTSDSDVPGPIEYLYWNEGIQTWYPRQRYTMNNSTDKWPYNAKFIFPVNGFVYPKI